MGTTEQFARFVVETTSEDIPSEAIEAAAVGLMYTVGTALFGRSQQIGRMNAPEIQGMTGKVTLTRDPTRGGLPKRLDYANQSEEIVVHLKDGSSSVTNTLRGHQLDIKSKANASHALPRGRVQRALGLFRNLEKSPQRKLGDGQCYVGVRTYLWGHRVEEP